MAIQQYPQPTPDAGIPSGDTANRPAAPVIGDQYYNGETLTLEIFDGTDWYPISATPGQYTIVATDVGTGVSFGAAQASITFTSAYTTGEPLGYVTYATTGGYTSTGTSSPMIITVGNDGSYSFNGLAYNDYGQGPISNTTTSIALTTIPATPTIGTAATSGTTTDVTITWTNGGNGGKNLSSITITPYLNGTTAQTSQTASTTSSTTHTFTGLTEGSAYTFKVKATNANGDSLESVATNSITVPTFDLVDFLVIAGGGGAGGRFNWGPGGGGAGGYRTSVGTSGGGSSSEPTLGIPVTTSFTVTVGAGGAGGVGADGGSAGVAGSASQLYNINSSGGGRGGGSNGNSVSGATSGGSGGGGNSFYQQNPAGGAGTTGQGTSGGFGASSNNVGQAGSGGGGGGAANAGTSMTTSGVIANGGNGISSNITGNAVTRGGGGAGGGNATGGNGGGGNGSTGGTGGAGSVNTGGGGGGGSINNVSTGGAGGSGIVVMVYASNLTANIGGGLTSTTNTDTSNSTKITTFNAGTGTVSLA